MNEVKTSPPVAYKCSKKIYLPLWRFVKPDIKHKLHKTMLQEKTL